MKKYHIFYYISSGLPLILMYIFVNNILNNLYVYKSQTYYLFFSNLLKLYSLLVIILFIINLVLLLFKNKIKNGLVSSLLSFYSLLFSIMTLKPGFAIITLILSIILFLYLVKTYSLDSTVHKKIEKDPKFFKYINKKQAVLLKILLIVLLLSFLVFRILSLNYIKVNDSGGALAKITSFTGLVGFFGLTYFSVILLGRSYDDKNSIQNKRECFLYILIIDIAILTYMLIFIFL